MTKKHLSLWGCDYVFCNYWFGFFIFITSPPIGGRARYCNAHVCLFVCVCVCLFVCPCFRKISKCNISAISQPIIMKLGIHITYGYTVTDKYFQNFRSKVKVVGRRKVKKSYLAISRERMVVEIRDPWWHGGRGLPSLIALLCVFMHSTIGTCSSNV